MSPDLLCRNRLAFCIVHIPATTMDVLAGCSGIARGSSLLAQGFSDANVGVDQHEDGGDDNDDGDDDDEPLSSFREGIRTYFHRT